MNINCNIKNIIFSNTTSFCDCGIKYEFNYLFSDEEINNTSDIKILTSKSEQYKKNINNLKSLNNAQIFNEFKMFLEIDKPHKFRDKMKGFLYKYWNDTEKIERYAPLTNDEYQKVKKQVKKFKNMREKSAREKENKNEKLKQELYNKKKEEFLLL